jgi:hypothetical protein
LLVAAGLGPRVEHALMCGLALNGLRVSGAAGADIEHLGAERGHRTLTITPEGGKVVTILLAPWTARAIDLATGDRCDGPVFITAGGRRLDRHGAGRIVRRVARCAGISKAMGPHTLRHAFITAALDAGGAAARCARGRPTCVPADQGTGQGLHGRDVPAPRRDPDLKYQPTDETGRCLARSLDAGHAPLPEGSRMPKVTVPSPARSSRRSSWLTEQPGSG